MIRALGNGFKYFKIYMSVTSTPEKPRLAFLGPSGTYTHQAAFERFGDSVEYTARPTIAEVLQVLSNNVPFGIIPQENSTNGSVVEAYNILRTPVIGRDIFVRGTTILRVEHSLVARRGVELDKIETVLSHEQALGQCREWLSTHLPQASLVHTDSTAGAAKILLSVTSELDPMKCAAICSSVVVDIYEDLEVLENSIQDGPENFTRFYILSHGRDVSFPAGRALPTESMALLRLHVPPGDPVNSTLNVPRVIGMLELNVLRIDRRPNIDARSFDDVYFIEVTAIPGQDCSWTKQLQKAVHRLESMSVQVSVLGFW